MITRWSRRVVLAVSRKPMILVVSGLVVLIAGVIVVEAGHFWGFYLGLAGAAVGYIGARLYLPRE